MGEQLKEIGKILTRDVDAITDKWCFQAMQALPDASPTRWDEMRNRLPKFLRLVGERLEAGTEGTLAPQRNIAFEHGAQRWKIGWNLAEVVDDYQLMRMVLTDHLSERLSDSLDIPSLRELNRILDEGIGASVIAYVEHQTEHTETLTTELGNRVQAILGYVRKLAQQTAQSEMNLEDFQTSFEQRLLSLDQAHELLSKNQWEKISIQELLDLVGTPFGGTSEQFSFEGAEEIKLNPRQAESLYLIFHELFSRAVKQERFSEESYRLTVRWSLKNEDIVAIDWRESGVNVSSEDQNHRYGASLIKRIVIDNLVGEVKLVFEKDCFSCQIEFPHELAEA